MMGALDDGSDEKRADGDGERENERAEMLRLGPSQGEPPSPQTSSPTIRCTISPPPPTDVGNACTLKAKPVIPAMAVARLPFAGGRADHQTSLRHW